MVEFSHDGREAGQYTVAQFTARYPMGKSTFYRIVSKGLLRITKLGSATRIAKADADAWAASLETKGGEALNAQ